MNLKPDPEDYVLYRAGSEEPRTKEFKVLEGTRDPKTDRWCIRCNKPLKLGQKFRYVHLVNGGSAILHPAEEHLYTSDTGDCGLHTLGMACARAIGIEWTSAPRS